MRKANNSKSREVGRLVYLFFYFSRKMHLVLYGNIIHCTQEAFLNVEKAKKGLESNTETFKNDPNFMAYICGPILLNED